MSRFVSVTIRRTQRELLRVLLAEHRRGRAGQVKQLEHHGQHAAEEARPELALEDLPHRARIDGHLGLTSGIHLGGGRREDELSPRAGAPGQVLVQGLRITIKIFTRPELQRVDEDRDDHAPRGPASVRAARSSRSWPTCRAPMVGTRTTGPGLGAGPRGGEFGPGPGEQRRRGGLPPVAHGRPPSTSSRRSASAGLEQPGRERAIRRQPGHGDVGGHRGR